MANYLYNLEVQEDGEPSVCEEDVRITLERLGYEAEIYEEGEGLFTIATARRLNRRAVQQDIEALDGASRCKVTLELYVSN